MVVPPEPSADVTQLTVVRTMSVVQMRTDDGYRVRKHALGSPKRSSVVNPGLLHTNEGFGRTDSHKINGKQTKKAVKAKQSQNKVKFSFVTIFAIGVVMAQGPRVI